jgi:uncharacterized damage-inducible protein DinB
MNALEPITALYDHNLWANLRLLEQCATLTDEQLDAAIVGTYGSIRDMLQHIVTSEQSYLSRISTGRPFVRSEPQRRLTLAEMIAIAQTTGAGFVEWAPKIRAEDTVEVDWDGVPRAVPKAVIMVQAINHATEHRAQIMVTLTQLGVEPPDLQGWAYFEERDSRPA